MDRRGALFFTIKQQNFVIPIYHIEELSYSLLADRETLLFFIRHVGLLLFAKRKTLFFFAKNDTSSPIPY